MILPRRVLVLLGVIAVMAAAMMTFQRWISAEGPALPAGTVQPYLTHDLLLAPDGTFWTITHSGSGGPSSLSLTPFVPGKRWKQVSGGFGSGMGIQEDGTLWRWQGYYPYSHSTPPTPAQIGLDRDWAKVCDGWQYAPLLKSDGSLWYLGDEYIDLKAPPTPLHNAMRPSRIGSDHDWTSIANCHGTCYALKKDGTLWQWGTIGYSAPFKTTPEQLGSDRDWSAITSCGFAFAALKKDGSLWVGGTNSQIVSLDFAGSGSGSPARVGPGTHWKEVQGGKDNLVARHADGSWWASGDNHYASLGLPHWLGHSKHLGKPTRIPISLEPWAWSPNENTTLLLTRDGSIYYMGKTPGSGAPSPKWGARAKKTINDRVTDLGLPSVFARPGESWSRKPVRIGELPASVVAALKSGA